MSGSFARLNKETLLEKYSRKDPKRFVQLDGFVLKGWDDVMKPDKQRHVVMAGETFELMVGTEVRVLVNPQSGKKDVVALLKKITSLLESQETTSPSEWGIVARTMFRSSF